MFGGRNVRGDLDDPLDNALRIRHRVVRGLNPDLPTTLADAFIFARVEFAAAELGPEITVLGGPGIVRFREQAVMLAFDLREVVAQVSAEILVCGENFPGSVEFDDGERAAKRAEHSLGVKSRRHFNTKPVNHPCWA